MLAAAAAEAAENIYIERSWKYVQIQIGFIVPIMQKCES